MKAVVVELKNDLAAVLSDDGCITTLKNNNFEIGQVINIHKSRISIPRKLGMVAASAAAFIILGTGLWAYASPYSYVSIDVNPSVEFNVNRFDRVIQVKAVNDDGEKILKELSLSELKNKTIKEALVNTVDQIDDAGYFNKVTQGSIVIAASCADKEKADSLAVELEQSITQATQENGDTVKVNAFSVDRERIAEAKKLGVTPGKLNLVEKLHEAEGNSSTFDIEEWLKKPVKDIMKATKDYKNESKEAISATGDDKSMNSQSNQEDSSQLNNDTNQGTDKDDKKSNNNKTETESDIENNDTSSSAKSSNTNTNSSDTKKETLKRSNSDNENISHNKSTGDNKKADSNNKDTGNNKNSVSDNNDTSNTKKSNSDSKDTSNNKNSVSDNNDNGNTKKSNSNNKDTSNNKNSDSDSKDTSNTKKSNSDNKDTSNNKNSVSDSKDTSNTNTSTKNGDNVNEKSSSSDNSIHAGNTSKTGSSEADNAKRNDKSANSTSNSSSSSDNSNKNNDKPKK